MSNLKDIKSEIEKYENDSNLTELNINSTSEFNSFVELKTELKTKTRIECGI